MSVPSLAIPPPSSPTTLPLAMVSPEMVTVFAAWTSNTRLALLPLTVITEAPGPVIVTFLSTSNSPVVSVIVPVNRAWKLIVAPSQTSRSAWRSEPAPLSFRLVTVAGLAQARTVCETVLEVEPR